MQFFLPRAAGRITRVVFCCVLLTGCAAQAPSPEWQLGQEGKAVYYFLVQLEAAATGDADAYAAAGEELLKLDPSEAAFLEMADFSLRRGRIEEARATARQGLSAFPTSLPLALFISDAYIQQSRIDDAVSTLRIFMRDNPENREALQELARTYLMGERYTEFDALIASVPPARMTPYLHYVKARSLLNRNKLAEGEKELRLVVRQAPDMVDAWVNLGIALQLQNKHAAALPMFRKAVDSDPENPGLWLRLLDAQLRGNRPELALRTLAEAPPSPTLRLEAGLVFVEAKRYAAARKIFQELRDEPDAPEEVHIYLAALAAENFNNPSEALRELAAIGPKSPLAERALRWRLQILEQNGRLREGAALAERFAQENPGSAEFQVLHAQAAAAAGDSATGIHILRAAHGKWPENPAIAMNLASLLDITKNRDEAMRLMEFVILHQPRNAFALNFVGYMLAEENQDLERAKDFIDRALAESPEDPHITDSLAWVLYRQGKYAEAWAAIRKSIALGGDHPAIWEHYGDIALKTDHVAEARKAYARALESNPDNPEDLRRKLKDLP